jgi:phage terminase large subunit GpA-like protein
MDRVGQVWKTALAKAMKPRTRLPCDEWCESNVRLSSRFTATPGPLRLDRTPFFRQPHKWFSDPMVWKIVSLASAQVAKTTWIANCLTYAICEDPGPCMYATSTGDNGQSWVEREWRPRVEECEALRNMKPDDPDAYKKAEMHFKSCTMNVVGAQSPANAASRPVRYLFCDEIDKWREANDRETDTLKLFMVRTRSFGHKKKILMASTPTTVKGNIYQEFLAGSQHRYFLECPHCAGKFALEFSVEEGLGGVKWPDECKVDGAWDMERVKREATYECHHCGKAIRQAAQRKMVEAGEWTRTNLNSQKGVISFHINTLYSLPWGEVAVLYLSKKDKPGGMQDFYNADLGLPYSAQHGGVSDANINAVVAASPEYYAPGRRLSDRAWQEENVYKLKIPLSEQFVAKRLVITMAVDVQKESYWWTHRLWMDDESSFLLDWGSAISEDDLTRLVCRRYDFCDGEPPLEVDTGIIDSGYRAKHEGGIYNFCKNSGGKFNPSKGKASGQGLYAPVAEGIIATGYGEDRINLIQYRDDMLKDWLYEQTIKRRVGPGWYLPRNIDSNYRAQLQDERMVETRNDKTGEERVEYVSGGNNHLADCEKMQFALRELLIKSLVAIKRTRATPVERPSSMPPVHVGSDGQWTRNYGLR